MIFWVRHFRHLAPRRAEPDILPELELYLMTTSLTHEFRPIPLPDYAEFAG